MQKVTILTLRNSSWLGPGGLRTPDSGTPNAQVARLPSVNGCCLDHGLGCVHHQVGVVCLPQVSSTTRMASSLAPKLGERPPDRAQFTGGSVRSRAPTAAATTRGTRPAAWGRLVTLDLSHHGRTVILSPAPPPSRTSVLLSIRVSVVANFICHLDWPGEVGVPGTTFFWVCEVFLGGLSV